MRWIDSLVLALCFSACTYCTLVRVIRDAVFVIEMSRHGFRAPSELTPAQPWMAGLNRYDLTATGFGQHYRIGRNMRTLYSKLLENVTKEEYLVWSTDTERTKLSALGQMAGVTDLFNGALNVSSPFEDPRIKFLLRDRKVSQALHEHNASIEYIKQNVHLHLVENYEDNVLYWVDRQMCPKFHLVYEDKRLAYINEIVKSNPYYVNDVETAAKKFGITLKEDPLDIWNACQRMGDYVLQDVYLNDHPLISPNSRTYQTLKMCYEFDILQRFIPEESTRALITPWATYLMAAFKAKANGTTDFKFNLFSTHDSSLIGILFASDLLDSQCFIDRAMKGMYKECTQAFPYPGSHIDFVLEKTKRNQYYVRTYYNRVAKDLCKLGNVQEEYRCPLDQFLAFWQARIHPDPSGYCGRTEREKATAERVHNQLLSKLNK